MSESRIELGADFFRQLRKGQRFSGIYTRVAAAVGCTPRHAHMVGSGKVVDPRTLEAILSAKREIEKSPYAVQPHVPAITPQERKEFQRYGRYYGVLASVAKTLGLSSTHVRHAAMGRSQGNAIRAAVRAEMDHIDAKLAEVQL